MELLGCVSIDVDTLSSIYKGKGCRRAGGYTYLELRQGLENLARFFEGYSIKTTLFMVGNDLLVPASHASLRATVQAGHEVANHSMTHPQGFRWLTKEQKEREIADMGDVCQRVLGVKPVGFRSPGWNIDDSTISVLVNQHYWYDSSLFPTYLMPFMKLTHWWSMRRQGKHERTTMGQLKYMFAPLQPYRTDAVSLARPGGGDLVEFPLSVTPFLRIPFFATTLLLSGFDFYEKLYRSIRKRALPIHFQFHLSDFVDYNTPELQEQMPVGEKGVYLPQALNVTLQQKWDLFKQMMDLLTSEYQFFTLRDLSIKMFPEIARQ
jgi:hypothetical protein